MEFIRIFSKLSKNDVSIAGGKGASLGEMTNAGIPVPDGFVILSSSFEKFIEETDLDVEIDSILHKVKHEDMRTVNKASEEIQALILNADMPNDIAIEIKKYFDRLEARYVAVRSSATAEDSSSAAWAGQLESYLNTTNNSLLENIKKCWASLFTPRAIFYKFEKELHKQKISVAVVVQRMIESEVSGIAFSVHPVTQDRNQLIIEAGCGLGEAIVSGQITPDSYVVEKEPRRIIDKNIAKQDKGLYRKKNGGNEWKEVKKGETQKLSDKEILHLSELLLKIEKHYDFPVDIEWAKEKSNFYIVQSRPITTLSTEIVGKKQSFEKIFARDFCMIALEIATISETRDNKEWMDEKNPHKPYILIERTDGTCNIWYNKEGVAWTNKVLASKVKTNKLFLKEVENKVREGIKFIRPLYEKQQSVDKNTLLRFIDEFLNVYSWIEAMWWIKSMDAKDLGIDHFNIVKLREETETLSAGTEIVIRKSLEKLYPNLGILSSMIRLEELRSNKILSKEILQKRLDGFTLVDNHLVLDSLISVSTKNNYDLDIPNVDKDVETFKGEPAYKGKVKGIVCRVMGHTDFGKIKQGEILVSPMTMVDFLSEMKKASAFITDEGGITSHVAITAREMKKPCVIGTKVATQILQDGDLVEVDADKGVVRVLRKESKKLGFSKEDINIKEWEFEFQQRNEHPILMADFWCRALYRKFAKEINLQVEPYDYFFTTSSKGYVKTAQKKIALEAIKRAFNEDRAYSTYLYNQTIKRVNELEITKKYILKEINKEVSNKKLIELWNRFDETFLTLIPWYWIPCYPIEQNILSDKIKEGLMKYKDKIEIITDFNNALMISISPTKEIAFKEEQKDFFNLVKIAIKKENFPNDKNFSQKAEEYLKKYSWMNTFVLLPIEPLTLNELIEKIKKTIVEKSIETYQLQEKKKVENDEISKKILKIIEKDKELLATIEEIKNIGWVLTWSVETSLHTLADLQPFFKLIAKQLGISYSHLIHLTSGEIVEILGGNIDLKEARLKEREKGYFFMMEKGIQKMAIGDEGKLISEWVEKNLNNVDENITELKGQSACSGHVKGKVRIALIAKDSYKLKDGEILVCAMTSPDYVPAMKRASAIITDEGGLLSHAAIMSREFGKPCIIGMKIATRVLKDGNLIDVNANEGTIKILKSS